MNRRGRPPHPDVLTPREQEVLGLLRQGLSNPQIAERLGISLDGAKYHVSEILGKLGLSSREEAARWQPEEARPWWATAFAPVAFAWRTASSALPVKLSSVALALSGGLLVAALGGLGLIAFLLLRDDGEETRRRQIAVENLTLEDVQERALAALSRPGMVLHTVSRTEANGASREREAWIDVERDAARIEGGAPGVPVLGPYVIFHRGSAWGLDEHGRFEEMPFGLDMESIAPLALDQTLWALYAFPDAVERSELRAATMDGISTIRAEIVTTYDADGHEARQRTRIYFDDQSFLPVLVDEHIDRAGLPDSDATIRFEHELVERNSLPDTFFSLDALRAMETTPVDDIMRAVKEGLAPYWLGEEFEGMVLHDARIAEHTGGISVLELTYKRGGGGPNDPPPADAPPSGVIIREFLSEGWQQWRSGLAHRSWWEDPRVTRTALEVPGLEATLYEDPNAHRPDVIPTSVPTPATPLPHWAASAVIAQSEDTVLLIEPNIGSIESNPYRRDGDALARLAQSLRPFEPPR